MDGRWWWCAGLPWHGQDGGWVYWTVRRRFIALAAFYCRRQSMEGGVRMMGGSFTVGATLRDAMVAVYVVIQILFG